MRNKLRYDLAPPFAIEQMAKVLTVGLNEHGERDWEQGRKWSEVLACAERHLNAIKCGEDYDKDTGLLHSAQAMTQLAFLTEYYKIYPQGDDRRHRFLKPPRIGLDIDEVVANFYGSWSKRFGLPDQNLFWTFDAQMKDKYQQMSHDREFWINIDPLFDPKELAFEPVCYITARSIDSALTAEWLKKFNFPQVPVYTVGVHGSKVDIAKEQKLDWFVDDSYNNFVELNNAGICTFLMDRLHNQKYEVGHKRIYSLQELASRFLK
jgi:hypothetical protein